MYFDKNIQTIQNNCLFRNVQPKEIPLRIQAKKFLELNEGNIIYQVGDNSHSAYLLIKGHIKVKAYENSGGSHYFEKFDNDFFGESELLEKIPRKSTAMAIRKSLLYVIDDKDLKELTKNKTVLANLFNPTSTISELSQSTFDEQEASIAFSGESGAEGATQDMNPPALADLDNFDEGEDDLSWNNSNIDEYEELLNDEVKRDIEEFSNDEQPIKFDYDYDGDSAISTEDQSVNSGAEYKVDESSLLFDTGKALNSFGNENDSIFDRIKEDMKEATGEPINKHLSDIGGLKQEEINPIISGREENKLNESENIQTENISLDTPIAELNIATPEQFGVSSTHESHQELINKNIISITNELKTPLELIKRYTNLLMRNSSSAEASRILQKILDQADAIASSIQAQEDYLTENINLKTQIYYAEKVLTDILQILAGYTEFRNVKLFRKFEADASVLLDKKLFYQASLQIIKFLCENITGEGNVFVTIRRNSETLIVEFTSNGPSFSDELLNYFNEQVIIKNNTGLNFAKKIIRAHGGAVSARNITGGGPELKLMLPIVK